jgi:hypothetical protein
MSAKDLQEIGNVDCFLLGERFSRFHTSSRGVMDIDAHCKRFFTRESLYTQDLFHDGRTVRLNSDLRRNVKHVHPLLHDVHVKVKNDCVIVRLGEAGHPDIMWFSEHSASAITWTNQGTSESSTKIQSACSTKGLFPEYETPACIGWSKAMLTCEGQLEKTGMDS